MHYLPKEDVGTYSMYRLDQYEVVQPYTCISHLEQFILRIQRPITKQAERPYPQTETPSSHYGNPSSMIVPPYLYQSSINLGKLVRSYSKT